VVFTTGKGQKIKQTSGNQTGMSIVRARGGNDCFALLPRIGFAQHVGDSNTIGDQFVQFVQK
jgi:hypothetical protein